MLCCKIKKVISYTSHITINVIIMQFNYNFRIHNQIIKLYKTFSLIYIHAVDKIKLIYDIGFIENTSGKLLDKGSFFLTFHL